MKFKLFSRSGRTATIRGLYGAIVTQARMSSFYRSYDVADTVEGRFDMIVLHLALLLRRVRGESVEIRALGQSVFDLFCLDMDHSLREMGIGDVAVPKHMQRLAEAFYGRSAAYDRALAEPGDDELVATLARNVYPGSTGSLTGPPRLAAYVRTATVCLGGQSGDMLERAELRFPHPDTISAR